ncbi:MAG: hypothetical protein U0165_09495 [Polyangiaceae bacterium]
MLDGQRKSSRGSSHRLLVGRVLTLLISSAVMLCASSGCDVSKMMTSSSTSKSTEQLNGGCTTKATQLKGTVPSGGKCEQAEECAPACCPCAQGKKAWMAAVCAEKVCATDADACAKTEDPANCK